MVKRRPDGYVVCPLGLNGVHVGEGDTFEEALGDVETAIRFHIERFGHDVVEDGSPVLEAIIADAVVAI